MINKRGGKVGPQRANRQRFPYEPRVIGGKLLMPAELQAIHRYVVDPPLLEDVTEEIRAVGPVNESSLTGSRRLSVCRSASVRSGAATIAA